MSSATQVLNSEALLFRNLAGLPMDLRERPAQAEQCVSQVADALARSGLDKGFSLLLLRQLSQNRLEELREARFLTDGMLERKETAALLLNQEADEVIQLLESNHIEIGVSRPGEDIQAALTEVLRLEDGLARHLTFAFDEQFGYLTTQTTMAGTGLLCSVSLHLPFIRRKQQAERAAQMAVERGLRLAPMGSVSQESDVFLLAARSTLGVS